MTERIAIYKALASVRRTLGRPVRRESVRTQVVEGIEIMTLVYSARYTDDDLPPYRLYRVAVFTAARKVSDTILDFPKPD